MNTKECIRRQDPNNYSDTETRTLSNLGAHVSDVTFLLKDNLGPPVSDVTFLLKREASTHGVYERRHPDWWEDCRFCEARLEIFANPGLVTARRTILGLPAEGRPGPCLLKSPLMISSKNLHYEFLLTISTGNLKESHSSNLTLLGIALQEPLAVS